MEQPLQPFTNFIQTIFQTISNTFIPKDDIITPDVELMPLFDVICLIHNSYYFNQKIFLEFEILTAQGEIEKLGLTGSIQTPIQDNHYFIFQEDYTNISHLISLKQVLQTVIIPPKP